MAVGGAVEDHRLHEDHRVRVADGAEEAFYWMGDPVGMCVEDIGCGAYLEAGGAHEETLAVL